MQKNRHICHFRHISYGDTHQSYVKIKTNQTN